MTHAAHAEFLAATLPALDLVYNLARRLAATPSDVDDLVQETYLRAYGAWVGGRRPRTVGPWIATICLNAGRTWLRRQKPEMSLDDLGSREAFLNEVHVDGHDVVDAAIASLDRQAVHEALLLLPEEQRMAITLMDLAGFTAAEAANITGSARGTMLARTHRGRKKLARLLERRVILDEEP